MKSATRRSITRISAATSLPLAALALLGILSPGAGSWSSLSAGEPIQFSREKPRLKASPDGSGRLAKDALNQSKGLVPNNPVELFPPINQQESTPRDPREERRRRTSENERKNWMFHERGEGQEREEEEMGIRDYSLEKDDGTAESIFAPKSNEARAVAGRPRLPSSMSRPPSQETSEEAPSARQPESAKPIKRSGNEDPQPDRVTGAHVYKELDLRKILTADNSSSGRGDAASREAASRSARTGALAARGREDQDRSRDGSSVGSPGTASASMAGTLPGGNSLSLGGNSTLSGPSATAPRATPSSLAPVAPRSSDFNNPLDRNFGGGTYNSSRPGFDASPGRSYNNPYSLYPPALSTPYYDSRSANSGYAPPASFNQRPAQNSAPSQSTWEKSRIPRP